jgi:hypothetical protein
METRRHQRQRPAGIAVVDDSNVVRHADICIFADKHGGSAPRNGVGDELRAVRLRAIERGEQPAGTDIAAIRGQAGNRCTVSAAGRGDPAKVVESLECHDNAEPAAWVPAYGRAVQIVQSTG